MATNEDTIEPADARVAVEELIKTIASRWSDENDEPDVDYSDT